MFNQTLASHLLVFSPQRQTEHFEVGRGRRKPCAKVSKHCFEVAVAVPVVISETPYCRSFITIYLHQENLKNKIKFEKKIAHPIKAKYLQ